jgi:hypothetical protein
MEIFFARETRMREAPSEQERTSLTREETLNYLKTKGVNALPIGSLRAHTTFLYVLPDEPIRRKLQPGQSYPKDVVASIVRVDDPSDVTPYVLMPGIEAPEKRRVHNAGGQIAYYAIDRKTGALLLVGTSYAITGDGPFAIEQEHIFAAADHLFPKSPKQKE